MARFLVLLTLVYCPVAAAQDAGRAQSMEHEAKLLFELGRNAFDEHRFEEALGYFQKSHRLSGRAKLQYNLAICHERLGQHEDGLAAYQLYLEQVPDAENRSLVEKRIAHLSWLVDRKRTGSGQAGPDETRKARQSGEVQLIVVDPYAGVAPQAEPTDAETARTTNSVSQPRKDDGAGVLESWWFWASVAVVAGGLTVGIVLVTQPEDSLSGPPGTNTGVTIVTLGGP